MKRQTALRTVHKVTNFGTNGGAETRVLYFLVCFCTNPVCMCTMFSKKNNTLSDANTSGSVCPERDSNPHDRNGQGILSPSCLPFHHPGRLCACKDKEKSAIGQTASASFARRRHRRSAYKLLDSERDARCDVRRRVN